MKRKLILLDCDGTMTDGKVITHEDNTVSLSFHVHDGMMLSYLTKTDHVIAIVTGAAHKSCINRARFLGITEVHTNVQNKAIVAQALQQKYGINYSDTIAIGDDINDIPLFEFAGTKIAPANAHPAIKKLADIITTKSGGNGAIREALDQFFTLKLNSIVSHVKQ